MNDELKIKKKLSAVLLLIIFFATYLATLPGGISSYRDSGDLVAASHSLGIAHPSGYPLYILLGKVFLTIVPWGNPSYKINVMSGLFGALAAILLFLSFWRVFAKDGRAAVVAGGLSACLFVSAKADWTMSQVAEMYSLNVFFAALILWLLAQETISPPFLCLIPFLLGLGLGGHQTLVLLAPGIGLWMILQKQKPTLAMAGFFLLGLSIYLYLPLRSRSQPLLDWGDPETWRGFWRVMTRADYGGVRLHPDRSALARTPQEIWEQLQLMVTAWRQQFGWLGIGLSLWGGLWAWRKSPFLKSVFLIFLASGPAFFLLANLDPNAVETLPILEPHLVLPNLCLALAAGAGFLGLFLFRPARWVSLAGAVLLVGLNLKSGFSYDMRRKDFVAYDYGKNLLATLAPGALLYNPDDPTTFVLSAFDICHGQGRAITPLVYFRTRWGYQRLKKQHPELLPQRDIRSGQELAQVLLEHNLAQGRPLYSEHPQKFPAHYFVFPEGMLYRLYAQAPSLETLFRRCENQWPLLRVRAGFVPQDFFQEHVLAYLANGYNNFGLEYAKQKHYDKAIFYYQKALTIIPGLYEAWNNQGIAYYTLKNYPKALSAYAQALALQPENPLLHYNMGIVYRSIEKTKEARASFEKALEKIFHAAAANELALLDYREGRIPEAINLWQKIIRQEPLYAAPYYNLGMAHRSLNRKVQAKQYYKRYGQLTQDPGEKKEIRQLLETLE